MKIGLVDVDSHNFPNLCLMKISAYHKARGDDVEMAKDGGTYDIAYISKVFTESREPRLEYAANETIRGGSGYDLSNKLPPEMEHAYPDYGLYPGLTKNTAFGWLTRGCPRVGHSVARGGFCITPEKDGCRSRKVADLPEFWKGQKKVVLFDQNILACKDREGLLRQLAESGAEIEFNGGMDIRHINPQTIAILRGIRVKDFHFAWDDPRENLEPYFRLFCESGLKSPNSVGVYVLTNKWSSTQEDLYRVYTLRGYGLMPFIMVYDKQKFVDGRGRWLPGVEGIYSEEELRHFKTCQHLQRYCGNRAILKSCPTFDSYEPYKRWVGQGKPVPGMEPIA